MHVSDEVKRVGRPRQWSDEAERKRAYRARRAAELAAPLEQRQVAQDARRAAAAARLEAAAARREADRWRQAASVAEQRSAQAEERAARADTTADGLRAERDEAGRLLRRKLQWAKHAELHRHDPEALLVLVAELYDELSAFRVELSRLRAQVQHPGAAPW
ncbi:MAG: hypothetical protein ACRD2W_22615 [Acidimicrobiales bacterium]